MQEVAVSVASQPGGSSPPMLGPSTDSSTIATSAQNALQPDSCSNTSVVPDVSSRRNLAPARRPGAAHEASESAPCPSAPQNAVSTSDNASAGSAAAALATIAMPSTA